MYTECAFASPIQKLPESSIVSHRAEVGKLLDSLENGNSSVHTALVVCTYFVFHAESAYFCKESNKSCKKVLKGAVEIYAVLSGTVIVGG